MALMFQGQSNAVEYVDRSGRPSTSKTTEDVKKIRELIHKGHHRIIHELADTVGMFDGRC
jgi:hypothetical protein